MNQQLADYLIKGGRVIDPASGRNGALDIRVIDGKIEAIGANLHANSTAVIDAKDCVVTPGLIDVHLHLMKGLGAFGVDPDIFGVGSGVTTSSTPAAPVTPCSMSFATTSPTTPRREC